MPKKRLPRSQETIKKILQLKEDFENGNISKEDFASNLLELGIKRFVEELLEEEVKEYLGRDYYERSDEANKGYRNGYKKGIIRTGEGKVVVDRPQVADAEETWRSRIWPVIKGRTEKLEQIAVEMYARGCSVRDIEEVLRDETGSVLLSRTIISQLNRRLWEEYEAFLKEDLSQLDVVYIFCDAVYESMRMQKGRKEGILVVWGILADGSKRMLTLELGNKESYEGWLEVFRRLKRRGLGEPVLGVSDGAPGLIRAFEEVFPKTMRQRCLVHKKRNILAKVGARDRDEVRHYLDSVYYAADKEMARRNAEIFKERFGGMYPSAIKSFEEDFEACIAYLACPIRHRKHICTNNLIERAFLEEKRRTKAAVRYFDERSCLAISFGALMRAQARWRRIPMNFEEQVAIMELRERLGHRPAHKEAKVDDQRVCQ